MRTSLICSIREILTFFYQTIIKPKQNILVNKKTTKFTIMKKIFSLILVIFTVFAYSQQRNQAHKMVKDLNPEQKAILKTKKMAIALDLSDSQLSQMMDLNKTWVQNHHDEIKTFKNTDKESLSTDQKFDAMNSMLDQKLTYQRKVAQILNDEQYQSWKKMEQRRMRSRHAKGDGHGKRSREQN